MMDFRKLGFKKAVATFLSVAICALFGFSAFAEGNELAENGMSINKLGFKYIPFSGTIKQIDERESSRLVTLEDKNGEIVNFSVSDDTYIDSTAKIEAGAEIVGFYDANKPAIMIYPPQYPAEVIVGYSEKSFVIVDRFDENLLSSDENLKLNLSDTTEIILQNGEKFDGELKGRILVVFHEFATASIPAQTTPSKIVVMYETAIPVPETIPEEITYENISIVVNGEEIEAPTPFINESDMVMVPLRPVAEALGFEINWDDETKSVMVGKGISLKIGEDYYVYMRTAPITLGHAPILVDERTYVPMSFFKEVLRMGTVYFFEGQLVIDSL